MRRIKPRGILAFKERRRTSEQLINGYHRQYESQKVVLRKLREETGYSLPVDDFTIKQPEFFQ